MKRLSLSERIEYSSYLSELLAHHPDLAAYVLEQAPVDISLLQTQIDLLVGHADIDFSQSEKQTEYLRRIKQRFTLLWAIAELLKSIKFADLGRLQSTFADKSIQFALEIAWSCDKSSRLFVNAGKVPTSESGIFVLGLGKLGGWDLNFSSDVDLISFYDKSKLQLKPMQGAAYAVTQCLQQLTTILSKNGPSGYIWRVDWRLRPHASLRNLCMVSEKALDFYHYQARPWHRLAMLKARCVAGDFQLGEQFLTDLNSFIWRQNLDYRAIDDIAMLKTKINLEHPALAQQRSKHTESLRHSRGVNLKLGHGGIREIEFIVNALQLLWGGRKPTLRASNTLRALSVIKDEGLLSKQDVSTLKRAYKFLRRAENRLQMLDNAQIYHVPEEADSLQKFLVLNDKRDDAVFDQMLTRHRQAVAGLFDAQFKEQESAKGRASSPYIWHAQPLSEDAQKIAQHWEEGFLCYGLSEGQAHHFAPLLEALSLEIERTGADVTESVIQIDEYFRRLPPGGQYFRLLRDFPWLLQKLISPVLLSPTMTILLRQSPHIIDRFLESRSSNKGSLDTTIVFSNRDYETRLENLRRLANEELYLYYSDYFEGRIEPNQFQKQLTQLGEGLLSASVQVACDEMRLDKPPIAVIGFGKLGSAGMMPKSDLDLVYVCASMDEHALATKFSSRLNTIINAPMREGRVYELDTRLRPSGHSGAVTMSLDSYQQHQLNRAHTWSHLALVPARFVAGDEKIGRQFSDIKREILSRPRELNQYKKDCARMLKRVRDQRMVDTQPGQFSVKLRPGGLFELEYLLSCFSILQCIDKPHLANAGFDALVGEVGQQFGDDTQKALCCLRALQLEIRLFGRDDERIDELPQPVLSHVLTTMNCSNVNELLELLDHALDTTVSLFEKFFEDHHWQDLSDWKEGRVNWV